MLSTIQKEMLVSITLLVPVIHSVAMEQVLAFADGKANDILENICHVNVVSPPSLKYIDWSK